MRPVAPRIHPVHWHVLRLMLRQRGDAGCGRAALVATGRLLHLLARTATCGSPRLRPGPPPGGLPIGPPRRRLAHALGLRSCFRSPGRRLAARLACLRLGPQFGGLPSARHVGGLRMGVGFAALICVGLPAALSFSGTTVMSVRLLGPAREARDEPARISGLEMPAPNNTMISIIILYCRPEIPAGSALTAVAGPSRRTTITLCQHLSIGSAVAVGLCPVSRRRQSSHSTDSPPPRRRPRAAGRPPVQPRNERTRRGTLQET